MLGIDIEALNDSYSSEEPTRSQLGVLAGPALIEFGNAWCGHCQRAQPLIVDAMVGHAEVRHFKIADGPGCPLGRSFKVKLWPTLIFRDAGAEVARLVRPTKSNEITQALLKMDPVRS